MVCKHEERDLLIGRMLGAGTARDVEATKGARMCDPERSVDLATLAVYMCAFLAVALAVFALTGRLYAAGFAGLLVTFGFPWDGVGKAIVEWRFGPGLSGRENGER